jgi:hypothetical protein
MRKLVNLLIVTILAAPFYSNAQTNPGKISGVVKDGYEKIVVGATVTLLKAPVFL